MIRGKIVGTIKQSMTARMYLEHLFVNIRNFPYITFFLKINLIMAEKQYDLVVELDKFKIDLQTEIDFVMSVCYPKFKPRHFMVNLDKLTIRELD